MKYLLFFFIFRFVSNTDKSTFIKSQHNNNNPSCIVCFQRSRKQTLGLISLVSVVARLVHVK